MSWKGLRNTHGDGDTESQQIEKVSKALQRYDTAAQSNIIELHTNTLLHTIKSIPVMLNDCKHTLYGYPQSINACTHMHSCTYTQ